VQCEKIKRRFAKLIVETRGFKGAGFQIAPFSTLTVLALPSRNVANMKPAFYFPSVSKLAFANLTLSPSVRARSSPCAWTFSHEEKRASKKLILRRGENKMQISYSQSSGKGRQARLALKMGLFDREHP